MTLDHRGGAQLLISGSQVLTGEDMPPIQDGGVLIEGGRIKAVGKRTELARESGVEELHLPGASILPGLVDCHEHLVGRGRFSTGTESFDEPAAMWALVFAHYCRETLHRGVTTVRVPGARDGVDLIARRAMQEGHLTGPRLICAGQPITMTGGHGHSLGIEADGPDACARAARSQLASGADFVKVMASGGVGVVRIGEDPTHPELTIAEMRAVVEVTNASGKTVAAHADGVVGIGNALEAGVHCIEHGIYLTPEQARFMAQHDRKLVPTLSTMTAIAHKSEEFGLDPGWAEIAERILDIHRRSFEAALEAGVMYATGTDSYGDIVDEVAEFLTYGILPYRAIQAATRDAALITNPSPGFGALVPGQAADVIAVEGDPLDDVQRLRDVRLVVASGEIVRAEQAALA